MHKARKSPLASMLTDPVKYEVDHLNVSLLVWREVANKWQARAEARKWALEAMAKDHENLRKQVRMLKRALLASGIVSGVMVVAGVVGWMR